MIRCYCFVFSITNLCNNKLMSTLMLTTQKIIGQIPKQFSQFPSRNVVYTKHFVSKTLLSCCQHWREVTGREGFQFVTSFLSDILSTKTIFLETVPCICLQDSRPIYALAGIFARAGTDMFFFLSPPQQFPIATTCVWSSPQRIIRS